MDEQFTNKSAVNYRVSTVRYDDMWIQIEMSLIYTGILRARERLYDPSLGIIDTCWQRIKLCHATINQA